MHVPDIYQIYPSRVIYKEHSKSVVISQLVLLFPIGITNPKVNYLPNYHRKLWTQQGGFNSY